MLYKPAKLSEGTNARWATNGGLNATTNTSSELVEDSTCHPSYINLLNTSCYRTLSKHQ